MLTRALFHLVLFFADPPKALASAREQGARMRGDAVLLATVLQVAVGLFLILRSPRADSIGGEQLALFVLFGAALFYGIQYVALLIEAALLSALMRFVRAPLSWPTALSCAALFLLASLPLSIVFLVPMATAEPSAPFEITLVTALFYGAYGAMVGYFLSRAAPRLGAGGAAAIGLALALGSFVVSQSIDVLLMGASPPPAAEAPAA